MGLWICEVNVLMKGDEAYPGVMEVLIAARAAGIQVAVTTTCGEIAEACLVNARLYSLIDWLVTQQEVRHQKPHPESIFTVLALAAIDPRSQAIRDVLCVGDAPDDIAAGKAAGVRTVGVVYEMADANEIAAAAPDRIIRSFDEMRQFIETPALSVSHLR
jgi:HAD superfamily hydrolase (TIGR01549 family)